MGTEKTKAHSTDEKIKKARKTAKEAAHEIFYRRMQKNQDELRWLYMELYNNDSMYAELCETIHGFYEERNRTLRSMDRKREADPE